MTNIKGHSIDLTRNRTPALWTGGMERERPELLSGGRGLHRPKAETRACPVPTSSSPDPIQLNSTGATKIWDTNLPWSYEAMFLLCVISLLIPALHLVPLAIVILHRELLNKLHLNPTRAWSCMQQMFLLKTWHYLSPLPVRWQHYT